MNENINITSVNEERVSQLKNYAIQKVQEIITEERSNGKSEDEIKELVEEIHAVIGAMLKQMDYNMQHSYKGKDGREYSNYNSLSQADDFYKQSENPEISHSPRL